MPIVKAAQYLANITADQDFNSELASVVFSFFAVDAVAVVERNPEGELRVADCWKDDGSAARALFPQAVDATVQDVLATGLFKEETLPASPDMTLFFIPIEVKNKVASVLIIGHHQPDMSLIKPLLNQYLAVARLAGTILTRIDYERENIRRKSDEKFRLLFESSRDPIFLLDKTGTIVECNVAAVQILGAVSRDQVLRRRLPEFAPVYQQEGQASAAKEEELLANIPAAGDTRYEWLIRRPDGSRLVVDAKVNTILMDEAKKHLVHWRDITVRKMIEDKLHLLNVALENKMHELEKANSCLEEEIAERRSAQEALRQSRDELLAGETQLKLYAARLAAANEGLAATNIELKSFANIVAHDFRTPMVNLKGFSGELETSLAELRRILKDNIVHVPDNVQRQINILLDSEIPDALSFIDSSVDRLSRMVDALLQLSRIGRREMNYQTIDMNSLVSEVLASYRKLIEDKNIAVRVGILPQIRSDIVATEQIIGNLVDNSLKYLLPGRPGTIAIDCLDRGDEYLFWVEDNGRGVAADDLEKIFDLFRRAGRQDVPGEGMGLACVRTLVRQLGWKIWCESEPGAGTKMKFTVPKRSALISGPGDIC
jgi:PAS domain S-box-containing protein